MKTKYVFNLLLIILGSFVLSSCGTSKKATTVDFYSVYSQKLGVELKGYEDKDLIKSMAAWKGTPYKYAAQTKSGTDCSGFVTSVYNEVYGKKLQRSSYDMVNDVKFINKDNMKAGDIVFFKISGKKISHVGIYIADNKFIHAATKNGVVVDDLNQDYYKKSFYRAGRVKM
jgi:lipoprotein Spr/probable lipoprotein NlpC